MENNNRSNLIAFLKGSTILMISNVCLKAINFFLLPLYTGNLTPEMLGVSDSVTSLTGVIFPLLVMGLDSAYSAFYFEKNELDRGTRVFTTLTATFFLLGILPCLGLMLSSLLSELLFGTEEYVIVIKIAMLSVSFNIWYLPFSLELRLQNRMGAFGGVNIIASLIMIVLNVVFLSVLKLGVYSLVLSTLLVHVVQLVAYMFIAKKIPARQNFDFALLKNMLTFAIPMLPNTVMTWILTLSDRYVLLFYHGNESVGLYSVGARFVNLLNVVISAFSTAYTTFAFSSKDNEGAKEQFRYIFTVMSMVLLFVAFTVSLFGKEIIMVMTAPEYAMSYAALRDLMFSQVLYSMGIIVGYGIFFAKKSKYSLYATSVAAVINLVLNFILIPKYGIAAAAATTFVGYLASFAVLNYFSQKCYPCDYGVKKVLITFAGLYFICLLASEVSMLTKLLLWLVCVLACCFVYRQLLKNLSFVAANYIKSLKGKA